jgi:hypothetical protein
MVDMSNIKCFYGSQGEAIQCFDRGDVDDIDSCFVTTSKLTGVNIEYLRLLTIVIGMPTTIFKKTGVDIEYETVDCRYWDAYNDIQEEWGEITCFFGKGNRILHCFETDDFDEDDPDTSVVEGLSGCGVYQDMIVCSDPDTSSDIDEERNPVSAMSMMPGWYREYLVPIVTLGLVVPGSVMGCASHEDDSVEYLGPEDNPGDDCDNCHQSEGPSHRNGVYTEDPHNIHTGVPSSRTGSGEIVQVMGGMECSYCHHPEGQNGDVSKEEFQQFFKEQNHPDGEMSHVYRQVCSDCHDQIWDWQSAKIPERFELNGENKPVNPTPTKECDDCHGETEADHASNPTDLAGCGVCHTATIDQFGDFILPDGVHIVGEGDKVLQGAALCLTCHDPLPAEVHGDNVVLNADMSTAEIAEECESCHPQAEYPHKVKKHQNDVVDVLENPGGEDGKRSCAICHDPLLPLSHEGEVVASYDMSLEKIAETCLDCHYEVGPAAGDYHRNGKDKAEYKPVLPACDICHEKVPPTDHYNGADLPGDSVGKIVAEVMENIGSTLDQIFSDVCYKCHDSNKTPDMDGRHVDIGSVAAKGAAAVCSSCHIDQQSEKDEKHVTHDEFPQTSWSPKPECVRCHSSESIALYNNPSGILDSVHPAATLEVGCVSCHNEAPDWSEVWGEALCGKCHGNPPGDPSNPFDPHGMVTESTDCGICHETDHGNELIDL